jgi:eukaryotic-like serine/threonine-protein kinase
VNVFPQLSNSGLEGRYEIHGELGAGGMARVYRATDTRHGRDVAIKVLRPEIAAAVGSDRFLAEIRVTAQLQHPNILPLFDSGDSDGLLYYVTPFVEGETLRELLDREKQLSIENALSIITGVCDALNYAHRKGVIHRDLKPENILLLDGKPIVADFGIALAIQNVGGDRLTATGTQVGTPSYMSPEQASGRDDVAPRSDIYSAGVLLYEMLVGEPPHTAGSTHVLLARILTEPPTPLSSLREAVPQHVHAATMKALAKTPADRFRTAEDFKQALLAGPAPLMRRRPSAVLSAATVVIGAGIVVGILFVLAGSRSPAIRSIAVLPLENAGPDTVDSYFMAGLHSEMIDQLSNIDSVLRVTSSWSSSRYRKSDKSLLQIGEALDVDAVVLGSRHRFGDSVRLQLHMVDVRNGERQIWSRSYTAHTGSTDFSAQVARDIAHHIRIELTPEDERRFASSDTDNPAALDAVYRGRTEWNKFTPAGLTNALQHFERAVALDSSYAEAYAGIADVYAVLPYYAPADPRVVFPKAKAAAAKAISLNPHHAIAHHALGWVLAVHDWDWENAERYLRRSLELNPNDAVGHTRYAHFLGWIGEVDAAIEYDRKARTLDPLSPRVIAHLGIMYHHRRDFDQAILIYREALLLQPNFARAYFDMGRALIAKGQFEEGVTAMETAVRLTGSRVGGSAAGLNSLGYAYARAGRKSEARAIAAQLEKKRANGFVSPLGIATVYIGLGEYDTAFHWLETAMRERDGDLILLQANTIYDPIRSDPRFHSLIRRIGFPRDRGWALVRQ